MKEASPVCASERLQHVFARDERLIDIIAGHSPQLAKLRNSPIRRIMAGGAFVWHLGGDLGGGAERGARN